MASCTFWCLHRNIVWKGILAALCKRRFASSIIWSKLRTDVFALVVRFPRTLENLASCWCFRTIHCFSYGLAPYCVYVALKNLVRSWSILIVVRLCAILGLDTSEMPCDSVNVNVKRKNEVVEPIRSPNFRKMAGDGTVYVCIIPRDTSLSIFTRFSNNILLITNNCKREKLNHDITKYF